MSEREKEMSAAMAHSDAMQALDTAMQDAVTQLGMVEEYSLRAATHALDAPISAELRRELVVLAERAADWLERVADAREEIALLESPPRKTPKRPTPAPPKPDA